MLPKQLFRVTVKGAKLRYAEKGGGTFLTERAARDRATTVRSKHSRGASPRRTSDLPLPEIKIFVTDCDWKEL